MAIKIEVEGYTGAEVRQQLEALLGVVPEELGTASEQGERAPEGCCRQADPVFIETAQPAPKRKRRTKAEMEAARAAETKPETEETPNADVVGGPAAVVCAVSDGGPAGGPSAPQDEPATSAPLSEEDLRANAREALQKVLAHATGGDPDKQEQGMAAALKIFGPFGGRRISELKPDQLPAFIAACEAAVA